MLVENIKLSATDVGVGPALVFLHGFPFNRFVWQKQADFFWTSYRVIAPDLRGFGASESHPGPAMMDDHAADLHALLLELGTGPVVLVGHSMGGYVALAFARLFPQMLRGLVLVDTKAGPDSGEGATKRVELARKVREGGVQVLVAAMAPLMLAAENHDAGMALEVRHSMAASRTKGVVGALLGMAIRPDATAVPPGIAVPTLVITGKDDEIIPPSESRKLAHAILGAQLNVIPHAGHLVAFEQAAEFNRVLEEWLASSGLAAESGLDPMARRVSPAHYAGRIEMSEKIRSPKHEWNK